MRVFRVKIVAESGATFSYVTKASNLTDATVRVLRQHKDAGEKEPWTLEVNFAPGLEIVE